MLFQRDSETCRRWRVGTTSGLLEESDFRPAVSRPKVGSQVLAMLVALLSVSAVLRSREEFLRLREKCTFTRTSAPGWSMLQRHGGYNASRDDPVERKLTIQTTWCVQPDSEPGHGSPKDLFRGS